MVYTLTDDNYIATLKAQRIAVVKVYANWCGPCKFMKSHYEKWSEQFKTYEGLNIPFYEIENDKNKAFITEFDVKKLPTLMFMVHGLPVFTIQGMTRVTIFEDTLKKSLEIKYDYKD